MRLYCIPFLICGLTLPALADDDSGRHRHDSRWACQDRRQAWRHRHRAPYPPFPPSRERVVFIPGPPVIHPLPVPPPAPVQIHFWFGF